MNEIIMRTGFKLEKKNVQKMTQAHFSGRSSFVVLTSESVGMLPAFCVCFWQGRHIGAAAEFIFTTAAVKQSPVKVLRAL